MATMGFKQAKNSDKVEQSMLVPETYTHAVGIGQTGSGKTTSFIYPNLKHRIEQGHGILVYDYKGNEHTSVKFFAQNAQRLDDVVEIGKPWGASINLIRQMSREDLSNLFDALLTHSEENRYWGNSAKSLGLDVLDIIGGLENLRECYEESGKSFSKHVSGFKTHNYVYPSNKTLSALVSCVNSYEKLIDFIEDLDDLDERLYRQIKTKINIAQKERSERQVKEEFDAILMSYSKLTKTIERVKNNLIIFTEGDNKSLRTILSSLLTPLTQISQNEAFNSDGIDIMDALNRGKIVVISTASLSDTILENLNSVIFSELSFRSHLGKTNPVTVFIDEAHRVLSKNSDLPIDILREAKVDVLLTFQDKNLLIDKIGKEKFKGLMANLSSQYYFHSNNIEDNDHRLDHLKPFEYMINMDHDAKVHRSVPLFIADRERYLCEYNYQKKHKIVKHFVKGYAGEKIILEYLPMLYAKGEFIAYDLNSEREFIVAYEDKAQRQACDNIFDGLLETIEMNVM